MSKKSYEIQPFMMEKMKLSGNELVLFAILWKETDGGKKMAQMDYQGWSAAMGVTIPTLYNVLNKLVDKGFICQECKSVYGVVMDAK